MLSILEEPTVIQFLKEYFVNVTADRNHIDNACAHNYFVSNGPVNPNASRHAFDELVIGQGTCNYDVKYKYKPAMIAEFFPYLLKNGRGYHSLCAKPPDSSIEVDEE